RRHQAGSPQHQWPLWQPARPCRVGGSGPGGEPRSHRAIDAPPRYQGHHGAATAGAHHRQPSRLPDRPESARAELHGRRAELPLTALRMAISVQRPGAGLIHHSDRGVQYASAEYRQVMQSAGLRASMSRKGDCYDNAPMESFFHTLKTELVYHRRYATRGEATRDIFAYIEGFYNRTRRHSAIGYISPIEMELTAA